MAVVDDGFEALLEPFYNGKKLTDPISTVGDKFQLLPAFLKVKGTLQTVIWLPGGTSHPIAKQIANMCAQVSSSSMCNHDLPLLLSLTDSLLFAGTLIPSTSSLIMSSRKFSRLIGPSGAMSRARSSLSFWISGSRGRIVPTSMSSAWPTRSPRKSVACET